MSIYLRSAAAHTLASAASSHEEASAERAQRAKLDLFKREERGGRERERERRGGGERRGKRKRERGERGGREGGGRRAPQACARTARRGQGAPQARPVQA